VLGMCISSLFPDSATFQLQFSFSLTIFYESDCINHRVIKSPLESGLAVRTRRHLKVGREYVRLWKQHVLWAVMLVLWHFLI